MEAGHVHVNKILCSLFFVLVHSQRRLSTSSQLVWKRRRWEQGLSMAALGLYSERAKTTNITESVCRRMRKETSVKSHQNGD